MDKTELGHLLLDGSAAPSRNDAALRKILGDAINDLPPPPGDGGR